jgi:hypothetical protein
MATSNGNAPGAPGIEPRWTSSAKDGLGTAYHTSSLIWFTLSHGIVNEVYFPFVDTPNTRDLQLLITDGATFFHEERRDLDHRTEMPEKNVLLFRMTNSEPSGRYRIIKEVIAEPRQAASLRAPGASSQRHGPAQFRLVARPGRAEVHSRAAPGDPHGLWRLPGFHPAIGRLRGHQRWLA